MTKCAERIVISSFTIEAVVVYPPPESCLVLSKVKKEQQWASLSFSV